MYVLVLKSNEFTSRVRIKNRLKKALRRREMKKLLEGQWGEEEREKKRRKRRENNKKLLFTAMPSYPHIVNGR